MPLAERSFAADGRPGVEGLVAAGGRLEPALLGLPEAREGLAPCWRCVRAGRGAVACALGRCRCDYRRPASGWAA